MPRPCAARDPFWDMDGRGVRRERKRDRMVATAAFLAAVVAVVLTAFVWLSELGPILESLGLG